MKSRNLAAGALALALAAATLLSSPPAQSVEQADTASELNAQTLSSTMRVTAPFDHALSLQDALDLADARAVAIVGIRVDNETAVGEFSTAEGFTTQQYTEWFQKEFGVVPQATGWIMERARPFNKDGSPTPVPDEPIVVTELPEFRAPSQVEESSATELEERSSALGEAPSATREMSARAASKRWEPTVVEVDIEEDTYNNGIQFRQYAFWDGGASPANKPNGFGMEFGVELYNGRGGTRFVTNTECPSDYKSAFIAQNQNFKLWGVSTGRTSLSSSVNAYADYNDLFDSCGRNSITIGMRNPDKIPQFSPGKYSILVSVLAPRGNRTSSHISGDVQLVDEVGCVFQPWLSLTDCMGLGASLAPGGYDLHRATLSVDRKWVAGPNRCWVSGGSGYSKPVPVIPTSATGCFG